jgi:hypothetical protein
LILIQPSQSIPIPATPEAVLFENKSENGLELLEISVPELTGETIEQIVSLGIQLESISGLGGEDYCKILKDCIS